MKTCLKLIGYIFFWVTVHAQSGEFQIVDSIVQKEIELRPLRLNDATANLKLIPKTHPFGKGEQLLFDIKYGFIKAGSATMSVVPQSDENKKFFKIRTTARSAGSFDVFYKVRDTVVSIVDAENIVSRRFTKKLREGGYLYNLHVDYDQVNGKANIHKIRYKDWDLKDIKKEKKFSLDVPEGVLDVLASFYKMRTLELKPGAIFYLTNHDNSKIYDLKIEVLKREDVKVPAGKFRCLKIEPKLKGEAIFKQKGRLWVWVTDDEYKIPIKMSSKIVVGSITTVLKRIESGPVIIPARLEK